MHLKAIAVLALIASLFTSCAGKFVGGGAIPGVADANQRATFGFALQADDTDNDGRSDTYRGEWQLVDHSTMQVFHGTIQSILHGVNPFTGVAEGDGAGRTANGGFFHVYLEDRGTPGVSAGDFVSFSVRDRNFEQVYANSGFLTAGNVSFIPED